MPEKIPEMKKLVFGEGLMAPSLDNEKSFTVRRYRAGAHDFVRDEVFIGEFKDGLNILCRATADTRRGSFQELTSPKRNLAKAGYWFDDTYFNDLAVYYPDLSWNETGAIIFYEILKVNGVPVVSFNEHTE